MKIVFTEIEDHNVRAFVWECGWIKLQNFAVAVCILGTERGYGDQCCACVMKGFIDVSEQEDEMNRVCYNMENSSRTPVWV